MSESNVQELRVANDSKTSKVAGAAVKYMQEGKTVILVAIGAGAVNQAIKAAATARGMVAPQGQDLAIVPGFRDEKVDMVEKTAIIMRFVRLQ